MNRLESIFKKLNHKTKNINENLLEKAVKQTDAKTLKFLLEHSEYDADTIIKRKPLLFMAVEKMDIPMVVMLLKMGAKTHRYNKHYMPCYDVFDFIYRVKGLTYAYREKIYQTIRDTEKKLNEERKKREMKKILKKAKYNAPFYIENEVASFIKFDPFVKAAIKGNKKFVIKNISHENKKILTIAFIESMNTEICKILLKNGVNINSGILTSEFDRDMGTTYDLHTALLRACEKNCSQKLAWLIKNGVNLNFAKFGTTSNIFIQSPTTEPLLHNYIKCLELLLKTGKFDNELNELLDLAIEEHKLKIIQLLINKFKVKYTKQNLRTAVSSNSISIIKFFLDLGVKIDQDLLETALENAHSETIRFLLKCSKSDVNSTINGQPLFFIPAKTRDTSSIIMLLKMGADITKKNKEGQDIFEFIKSLKQLSNKNKENLIKEIKEAAAKISKNNL